MPEIKHNFIKGRMNKDLDERLVADGEYRDALNIQVVTSDGSDTGTAQNIKGNTLRSITNDMYCGDYGACGASVIGAGKYDVEGCVTVGTVTNPTKNTILWLQHLNYKAYNLGANLWQVLEFDRILEYNTLTNSVTPVLVDNYKTTTYNKLAAKGSVTGMVLNPNALGLKTQGIRVGMEVKCWDANGDNVWATFGNAHYIHEDVIVTVVDVVPNTSITLSRSNHATVAGTTYTEDTAPGVITFSLQSELTFEEDRVLNLNEDRLVTGINIVDDMLFFTDNETEPKKVHIERSKLGTQDLLSHTKVYANGILYDGNSGNKLEYIKEKHITVIKKSPLFPPTLEVSNTLRGGGASIVNTVAPNYPIFSNNAIGGFSGSCASFSGAYVLQEDGFMFNNASSPPGLYFIDDDINVANPTTTILIPNGGGDINWLPLDKIILKATSVSQGIANIHEVHAVVLAVPQSYDNQVSTAKECYAHQNGYSSVSIEFTSIPTDIPTNYDEIVSWDITLNQEKESIFRFKFPKFSYRWKYEDGEYSSFSPFTEAAFVPSKFDYMPRKGFNLGMTNDIRMLKLSDFVNMETPDDVTEIDILYKESNSPNIYTVKTIKKERGAGINGTPTPADIEWTSDLLSIESDIIYASVPSNQLLRPWDNVPRKALGQEVTANRLVFANYLQNYDLIRETGEVVSPNLSMSISDVIYNNPDLPKFSIDDTPDAKMPERSVKSLRTYQIGIVYKDVYGRETPVLTNYNPAGNVMSMYLDKLRAQKYNQIVVSKSNFSNNLEHPEWADSFKFFVKETSNEYYNLAMDRWYQAEDGNVWLSFPSSDRNKVDDETFIILKKQHDNDNPVEDRARYKVLAIENTAPEFITKKNFSFGDVVTSFAPTGLPLTDSKFVDINTLTFTATSLGGTIFPEKEKNLKLRVSTATNKSFFYKISDMTEIGSVVRITIDGAFGTDMDFTGDGSGGVVGGISLEIVQERKEPTKEFQGRFFIKIHRDVDLEANVLQQSTTQDFVVVDTLRFAALNVGELNASAGIYGFDATTGGSISATAKQPWELLKQAKFSGSSDWGHKEYLDPIDLQLVKQFWNSDRGGALANTNSLQYSVPAPAASGSSGTGYVSGDAWNRFSWFIDSQWGENPIKNGISYSASKTYGYGEELKVSEILAADGGGGHGADFAMGHVIQGGNTADLTSTGYLSGLLGSNFVGVSGDGNGTGLDATSWLPNVNNKVGKRQGNNGFSGPIDNNVYKLGVSRIITPTSSGVPNVWLNVDRNHESNAWTGFTNPHLKPAPGAFPFPNTTGGSLHVFNDIDELQYRFINPQGGTPAIDANSYYLQGDYETVDRDLYVVANGFNAHKFTAQHDGTIVQMNAQFQVRPALDCDSDHPTDPYGEIQFAVNNLFPQGAGQVALAGRTYGDTNLGVSGSIGSFKELVVNVPDALPGQNNIGQPVLSTAKLFRSDYQWDPQPFPHTKTTGGECPGCMHTGNFRGEIPDSMAALNGGQPAGGLTGINVRLKLYHNNTTFPENVASGHVLADESTGFVPEQMGNALSFTSLEELDSPNYLATLTPGSVMSRGDHFFAKNDTRLQLILAVDHQAAGNRIKLNAGESVWLELESYEKEFNYEHHISEQNFSAWYNAMHEGWINAHPSLVADLGVNPGNVEAGSGLVWDGPDFPFGDAPDIGIADNSGNYPTRREQYTLANAHYKFRGNYGGPIEIVEGSELDCNLNQDFTHDLITSQMEANVNLGVSDGNELGKIKRPIWGDAMHPWDDGSYYFGTPKFANDGAASAYTYSGTPTAFWHDTFLTKDRVGRLFGGVALPTGFNTNKDDIVDTSVSWANLCNSVTNDAGCEQKTLGNNIVYSPTYHPEDTWNFQTAYWHYIFGSFPGGVMMTAVEQKIAGWYGGGCQDTFCQKAHNKINEASPLNRIPDSFLTSLALNQWAGDSHATGVVDGVGNGAASDGDYSVSGGARVYSRRKNHYNPFAFGKQDSIVDWGLLNHKHSLLFGVDGRLGSHSRIATATINSSNLKHIIQAVSSGNYINYSFQWDPADKAYNYGYPLLFPFHKESNGATYDYDASTNAIGSIGNWNTSATNHDDIDGWIGTRIGEDAANLCDYCNHTYSPRADSNFTLLKGLVASGNIHSGLVHDMTTSFNPALPAVITLHGEPNLGAELDATFAGSQLVEFWDGGLNFVGSMLQPQTIVSSVGAGVAGTGFTSYDLSLSKTLNTTLSWNSGAFILLANGGNSNTANGSNPRVSLINSSTNTDVLLHPTPWSDDLRDIYYAPSTGGLVVNASSWYNDTYHSISSAIPNVSSAKDFSGYGLHDEGKKLHLSFGGINNTMESWKKAAYNLNVWHPELSSNLNNLKSSGSYFRFREDPNGCIFKINSTINSYDQNTNGIGIRNYMPAYENTSEEEWDHPSFNATHALDDVQDPYSKRVRFYLEVEYTGWNRNTTTDLYEQNQDALATHMGIGHKNNVSASPGVFPELKYNPVLGVQGKPVSSNFIGSNPSIQGELYNTLEFVSPDWDGSEDFTTTNPAIWETEPKEDLDLDIYHEASPSYPINLNEHNAENYFKIGSVVTSPSSNINAFMVLTGIAMVNGDVELTIDTNGTTLASSDINYASNRVLRFTIQDGSYVEAVIKRYYYTLGNWTGVVTVESTSTLDKDSSFGLPYFNCFSFGNGVESDRIRDDFNAVTIGKGVKVSTTIGEQYKEERRKSGFIFSGIYNSNSGVNQLNQFISVDKITKELNPVYGSIQKLHARDTDIITFCEDKVLKVLANKDALFNADGNFQLLSSDKVLGQAVPYAGDYGISKNPESFSSYGYRNYFVDQKRGCVLRLSKNGIELLSDYGMSGWFRDNLDANEHSISKVIGTYDPHGNNYDVTIHRDTSDKTISFNEKTNSWVSFKSYIQNLGIGLNGKYYTFKQGEIWEHYSNFYRNNFYKSFATLNQLHYNSTVEFIFNQSPDVVKSFNTINYEGTAARITQNAPTSVQEKLDGVSYSSHDGSRPPSGFGEYFNNSANVLGWYVNLITTNLQSGKTIEFKNKEGKYYAPIKGEKTIYSASSKPGNIDTSELSVQGIGSAMTIEDFTSPTGAPQDYVLSISADCWSGVIFGCTDPTASNYDPLATAEFPVSSCCSDLGCMNPVASNYNPTACAPDPLNPCLGLVYGCTDNPASSANIRYKQKVWPLIGFYAVGFGGNNYNALANVDNGSCCYYEGCNDPTALNYNANATCNDSSCVAIIYGCTDPTAFNYYPGANENDPNNPCCYVKGCTDPTANNYLATACIDDGTCTYSYGCMDSTALNYDANATSQGSTICCFQEGCMDDTVGRWVNFIGKCRDGVDPGTSITQCDYPCTVAGAVYGQCGWLRYGTFKSQPSCQSTQTLNNPGNGYTTAYDIDYIVYDAAGQVVSTQTQTGIKDYSGFTNIAANTYDWCGIDIAEGCRDLTPGDNQDVNGYCSNGITFVGIGVGGCVGTGYYWESVDIPTWCSDPDQTLYPYGNGTDLPLPSGVGSNYSITAFRLANLQCPGHNSNECDLSGCTDDNYANYDALATIDDGSCNNIAYCPATAPFHYPGAVNPDGSFLTAGYMDTSGSYTIAPAFTYSGAISPTVKIKTYSDDKQMEKLFDGISATSGVLSDPSNVASTTGIADGTCTVCLKNGWGSYSSGVDMFYCSQFGLTSTGGLATQYAIYDSEQVVQHTCGNQLSTTLQTTWGGDAVSPINENQLHTTWPYRLNNYGVPLINKSRIGMFNYDFNSLQDLIQLEYLNLDGHQVGAIVGLRNNIHLKELSLMENRLGYMNDDYLSNPLALDGLEFATNLQHLNISNTQRWTSSSTSSSTVPGSQALRGNGDLPVFMGDVYNQSTSYLRGSDNNGGFYGPIKTFGGSTQYVGVNKVSLTALYNVLNTSGTGFGYTNPIYPSITEEYVSHLEYLDISNQLLQQLWEQYDTSNTSSMTTVIGRQTPILINSNTLAFNLRLPYDDATNQPFSAVLKEFHAQSSPIPSVCFNDGFNHGYYPTEDAAGANLVDVNDIQNLSYDWARQAALQVMDVRYSQNFAHINLPYNNDLERLYVGRGNFHYGQGAGSGSLEPYSSPIILPTPNMLSTNLGLIIDSNAADDGLITNHNGSVNPIPFDFNVSVNKLHTLVIEGERVGGSMNQYSQSYKGDGVTTTDCHNCDNCTDELSPATFGGYALESMNSCGNELNIVSAFELQTVDITVWTNAAVGHETPSNTNQDARGKSHIYFGRPNVELHGGDHPNMKYTTHFYDRNNTSGVYGRSGNTGVNTSHSDPAVDINLQSEIYDLDAVALKSSGIVPGAYIASIVHDGTIVDVNDSNFALYLQTWGGQIGVSSVSDLARVVSVNETSIKLSMPLKRQLELEDNASPQFKLTNQGGAGSTMTTHSSSSGKIFANVPAEASDGLRIIFGQGCGSIMALAQRFSVGGVNGEDTYPSHVIGDLPSYSPSLSNIHAMAIGQRQVPSDVVMHFGSEASVSLFLQTSGTTVDADGRVTSGPTNPNYDFKGYEGGVVDWLAPNNTTVSYTVDVFIVP